MLIRVIACCLAFVLAPALTCLAAEEIKIGAILSVTGPASFLGEPEKNTLNLLREELNAKGGILGKPLSLVIYDDESDVNKAVLAADRLLRMDKVAAVLGPSISGSTLAVLGKFNEAKTVLFSCSAAEKIVKPVAPYIFKSPFSDRQAVIKILAHAKQAGYKKLALLSVSDSFGQAGREVLRELIPAGGFEMTADEVYGPKDTDMTAQLTKIKGASPDAIICWGTNPGPAVIAKNRVQLGIKIPLYMSHGVASDKFIELAGGAANGLLLPSGKLIVAAQLPDNDPQKALLLAYAAKYEEKFKAPVSSFGGYAYDSLKLLLAAVELAGSDEPEKIRDALEKIRDFPAVGGVFNLSPEDHNGLDESSIVMLCIEDGKWKIIND